jgi:hypothetical protein
VDPPARRNTYREHRRKTSDARVGAAQAPSTARPQAIRSRRFMTSKAHEHDIFLARLTLPGVEAGGAI